LNPVRLSVRTVDQLVTALNTEITRQKMKCKCKHRFRAYIVKSGSIFVKLRQKWPSAHFTHRRIGPTYHQRKYFFEIISVMQLSGKVACRSSHPGCVYVLVTEALVTTSSRRRRCDKLVEQYNLPETKHGDFLITSVEHWNYETENETYRLGNAMSDSNGWKCL